MPAFQAGVAGSTPVDGSRSGVRRWRPWPRFERGARRFDSCTRSFALVAQLAEAPGSNPGSAGSNPAWGTDAFEAHEVERVLGTDEAEGSNPSEGSLRL